MRRALPRHERRLVAPWCFLDHFGPLSSTRAKPMDVAPPPHIGLQTVTWMIEGEALHNSLDHEQLMRPGQLNLMTAGRGIAHPGRDTLDTRGRCTDHEASRAGARDAGPAHGR